MTTCPNCGAKNDPGNRFCDQCGTRLDAAAPAAVAPDQPTVAAPACPNCGSTVLPGEAFCDNCGADLTAITAASAAPAPAAPAPAAPAATSADAPTILAAPGSVEAAAAASAPATPAAASGQTNCPICGTPALPGERFCDNCGADLTVPAPAFDSAPAGAAAPPATPVSPNDATILASPGAGPGQVPIEVEPSPAQSVPADAVPAQPDDATILAPIAEAAPVPAIPVPPPAPTDAPPIAEAAPGTPAADPRPSTAPAAEVTPVPLSDANASTVEAEAVAAPDAAPAAAPAAPAAGPDPAEVARLEGLVAAHRDTVSQYEQMASRYPAGSTPAFITAGLDAARAELAKAEADLAALPAAPAGPDPAEVARLEGLVAAHRDTVSQYEQMASRYPAGSTPAFITAGLDAARAELTKAEADLAALTGGAPAATATAPAAPVTATAPAAPEPAAPAAPAAPVAPAAPAAAPAALGPRLVLGDGQVIKLPADRAEIIIGREDPVSNIFPEVDLTPHGGESGGVSRQHAKITHSGGQWMLTDLNSTNYTRIDGARLDPNVPAPLNDGAKVQFGRVAATFHL